MAQVEVSGHVTGVDVLHQGELAPFLETENLIIMREDKQGLDCRMVRHFKPSCINVYKEF